VLVYRFLTAVPTLLLGLGAAFTWRRQKPKPPSDAYHPVGAMPGNGGQSSLEP
jgi:hypothetical protein